MDGFLPQFLEVAWRLIAIIVGLLLLAGFVWWRNKNKKRAAIEKKREEQDALLSSNPRKKANKKSRPQEMTQSLEDEYEEDFFPVSSQGSIFDDEELFPDDEAPFVAESNDDPLADLYAARAESQDSQISANTDDDEEEAVDLASLLVGMVEEAEEPKDYHLLADTPVAVKLTTKRMAVAQELLSIFRDERDSRLMVQIGDVAYRTLVDDATAKKTFTVIMKELSGVVLNPDENPPEDADMTGINLNKMLAQSVDMQVSSGGDTTAREMISILRDEADGHSIIQIGNTGYRTLVDNAKAKTGFSKIMKELSEAVTTSDNNPPIVPKVEKAQVAPPVQASSSIFDDTDDEVLPGDIRMPKMDEMPDAYKVDRFGRIKVKKVGKKVEEINIAEAIEAYLQHKISLTPEFQKRGIHIWSAFGGGVRIEVDGKNYEFVDEVDDDTARNFIKEAIDEWQERH